ncbi:hypothetical protein OESDEN_23962 [Oesophagostomum dentatum]|uniref:Uncharacterized protein n=1 Tax=Oesophagostomum dentatum TaxID=61180 RepID=A0A0B1RTK8_OESDE|nr:hypothetical protein OESDEN_23962 [Oesophagostomum dentatum]
MLDLLSLRPLAMRTRLQAAQMINPSQAGVDFEWFHELIKTVCLPSSLYKTSSVFLLRNHVLGSTILHHN